MEFSSNIFCLRAEFAVPSLIYDHDRPGHPRTRTLNTERVFLLVCLFVFEDVKGACVQHWIQLSRTSLFFCPV